MKNKIIEETKQLIIQMLLTLGEISLVALHKNFANTKYKLYISMAIYDLARNNMIMFYYDKLGTSSVINLTVISLANN